MSRLQNSGAAAWFRPFPPIGLPCCVEAPLAQNRKLLILDMLHSQVPGRTTIPITIS